jgi:DNA-binding PadR family transcriptional regulator
VQRARAEGRPPRRYYELSGAGAEVLEEALALHPDAAQPQGALGALPRPRPA